eukprot:6210923-Pleurochrysis_carterae.AAC.1
MESYAFRGFALACAEAGNKQISTTSVWIQASIQRLRRFASPSLWDISCAPGNRVAPGRGPRGATPRPSIATDAPASSERKDAHLMTLVFAGAGTKSGLDMKLSLRASSRPTCADTTALSEYH